MRPKFIRVMKNATTMLRKRQQNTGCPISMAEKNSHVVET